MYPSVAAAANPQQAQANVQTGISQIGAVMGQMLNSGMMTQPEYQTIYSVMQRPDQMQKIQQGIINQYGGMAVSQQTLYEHMTNVINDALRTLRASTMQQPMYMNQYPGMGMQQPMGMGMGMGMGQPMPMNGYNPNMYQQMNQNNSLREMYGTGAMQQTVQMSQMSPLPTQTNNAPAMVQQQVVPTPVQQAEPVAEHTGRAYDLELNKSEPIGFEIEEDLEPHPDHIDYGSYWEDIIEPVDPNAPKVRKFLDDFQIIWMHMRAAQLKAKHAQIKTTTPVETAEEVVTDINVNNPEIVEPDKFVHVVNYDKITTVHIPFAEGKKYMDEAVSKVMNDSTPNGVLEVLRYLQSVGEFGSVVSKLVLESFNKAASVNFVRRKIRPDGTVSVVRLPHMDSIAKLGGVLTDNGDPDIEEWKENKEAFKRALKDTLNASFFRIFRTDGRNYLDINDPVDRTFALSSINGLRFFGLPSKLLPMVSISDPKKQEELEQEIQTKLSGVFPILVDSKLILHNLHVDLGLSSGQKVAVCEKTAESMIFKKLIEKYGTMQIVDISDPDQIQHQLTAGTMYGGDVIVRDVS